MFKVLTDKTQAEDLRRIANKGLGGPKIGKHVGSGIFVTIVETWNQVGICPIGWTVNYDVIKNPTKEEYAVAIPSDTRDDSKLAAGEKTSLESARSTSVAELPKDYESKSPDGKEALDSGSK